MAWRCRFLTARPSQDGRVIAEKRLSELSVHPTHWLISTQVEIFSVFTFENPFGKGGFWTLKDDRVPGDFGWDPMDMYPTDPAGRVEMQTKELNNGRVAMIAIAGMVAQELATGAKLF